MSETTSKNISVYLESNPNPQSLKFVVNEMLVPEGMSFDFPTAEEAAKAPLARELFTYPFVVRVFYMGNFITVTKKGNWEWREVQDSIKNHIKSFLESGKSLFDEPILEKKEEEGQEVVQKIKAILNDYVRPAVEQDGGAITFHSYVDGVVNVTLEGACNGCPSSTITLKAGIENLFKKMMPEEVKAVEALG